MSLSHTLVRVLLHHRLPLLALSGASSSSTRLGPPGYDTLRTSHLEYTPSEIILSNLHTSILKAAPRSECDPSLAFRFQQSIHEAADMAEYPVNSEADLSSFLTTHLFRPINLHLHRAFDGQCIWKPSSTRLWSAAPDLVLRLFAGGGKTLGTMELKTAMAVQSEDLESLQADFNAGKIQIDADGRAIPVAHIGKVSADGKLVTGSKRRASPVCHLLDQAHAQLILLGAKFAIISNYEVWIVLQRDGSTFSISSPVSWADRADVDHLSASPLGLILGVTFDAFDSR